MDRSSRRTALCTSSIALVLVLVICLAPATAWAADANPLGPGHQLGAGVLGGAGGLPGLSRPDGRARIAGVTAATTTDDDIPGTDITAPAYPDGTLDPASDTDDVYRIWVPWGTRLVIELTGDAGSDFDVAVYGPDATSVFGLDEPVNWSNKAGTSTELVSVTSAYGGAGYYYIDVYVDPDDPAAVAGGYGLRVNADPDGDIPGVTEFPASGSRILNGTLDRLYDFDDVYRTYLARHQVLLAQPAGPIAPSWLALWDDTAVSVDTTTGLADLSFIGFPSQYGGPVLHWAQTEGYAYLDVGYPYSSDSSWDYAVQAKVLPVDDDFDIPGTPIMNPMGMTRFMHPDSNASDVFRFHVNAGDPIVITSTSSAPGTVVDLYLYAPGTQTVWGSEEPLDESTEYSSEEYIYVPSAPVSGDYYVHVRQSLLFNVTGGTYTVQVSSRRATSMTIRTSATSVTRPKPFILQGLFDGGSPGDLVIVWVKKPGKRYYSYSSNRIAFAGAGGTNWWYRYTPIARTCPAGTYYFKSSYPGSANKAACVSPVISVRVR